MLVIVNPRAGGGRARSRWARIRPEVERRVGPFDEFVEEGIDAVRARVVAALDEGERHFVAAGGDGTVNLMVGLLMASTTHETRSDIALGAIGLGSSNDFHKPNGPATTIGGCPCRFDFASAHPHDIGCTRYQTDDGNLKLHRWLSNASIGVTARGNWLYNESRGLIGLAKRLAPTLGMVFAAVKALFEPFEHLLTVIPDNRPEQTCRVRNLGVVKNPHFTGCLHYDSPYQPCSGSFFVHVLTEGSPWQTLITLARLARGHFLGTPGTVSWRGRRLALAAEQPFAIEGDGEIVLANHVEFVLEPCALRVCAR